MSGLVKKNSNTAVYREKLHTKMTCFFFQLQLALKTNYKRLNNSVLNLSESSKGSIKILANSSSFKGLKIYINPLPQNDDFRRPREKNLLKTL